MCSVHHKLTHVFGQDANDLPARDMQRELNRKLLLLIRPGTLRTAHLSKDAALSEEFSNGDSGKCIFGQEVSFNRKGIDNQIGASRLNRRISLGDLTESIRASVDYQIVTDARTQGSRRTILAEMVEYAIEDDENLEPKSKKVSTTSVNQRRRSGSRKSRRVTLMSDSDPTSRLTTHAPTSPKSRILSTLEVPGAVPARVSPLDNGRHEFPSESSDRGNAQTAQVE